MNDREVYFLLMTVISAGVSLSKVFQLQNRCSGVTAEVGRCVPATKLRF